MNRLSGYQIKPDHHLYLHVSQKENPDENKGRVKSIRENCQLGGEGYRSSFKEASKRSYSTSVKGKIIHRIGKAFKKALSTVIESFRRSFSHLGQFRSRVDRTGEYEGKFDGDLEEISPFEKGLKDHLIPLSGRMADISSAHTNLMDVYTLTVGDGEAAEGVADAFITALENSEKNEYKIFLFKERTEDVSLDNRRALGQLHGILKLEGSREALVSCLKVKVAKRNNSIHILSPLQEAIDHLADKDQAQVIGKYLMGEICTTGGGVRSFELANLDRILNHEKIKSSPLLKEGVLLSAREVMKGAIQKSRSNILFSLLQSNHLAQEESREVKKQIIDWEKSSRDDLKFDHSSVKEKAKELGLTSGIDDVDIQKMFDVLENYIKINQRLSDQ